MAWVPCGLYYIFCWKPACRYKRHSLCFVFCFFWFLFFIHSGYFPFRNGKPKPIDVILGLQASCNEYSVCCLLSCFTDISTDIISMLFDSFVGNWEEDQVPLAWSAVDSKPAVVVRQAVPAHQLATAAAESRPARTPALAGTGGGRAPPTDAAQRRREPGNGPAPAAAVSAVPAAWPLRMSGPRGCRRWSGARKGFGKRAGECPAKVCYYWSPGINMSCRRVAAVLHVGPITVLRFKLISDCVPGRAPCCVSGQ